MMQATPSPERQPVDLPSLTSNLTKLDPEYISHVSVQIATLKTIRYQLEEALNCKVTYSANVGVMQDLKIRGMEQHIHAAIEMLPRC